MSKHLDEFIRNNRRDFDDEEPSPSVWSQIDQRLGHKAPPAKLLALNWKRWSAAAAILLLCSAAVIYWMGNRKPAADQIAATPPQKTERELLNEINPAYAKEVYHFTQLIEIKQAELKQLENDDPQLYKQFVGEINKLDSSYNLLQKELPANPNREQLLEAMIRNLQVQMDLLNQQLQIIQQIKQSKNKNNAINSKTT